MRAAPASSTPQQRRRLDDVVSASRLSSQAQVFARSDPPYEITAVNAAWTSLCGWTQDEAVGQTCRILQGPDTSREAIACLHSALRARTGVTIRLLNYTKQGEPFVNDLTLEPLVSGRDSGDSEEAGGECRVTHFVGSLQGWKQPDRRPPRDPLAFETTGEQKDSRLIRGKMPRKLSEAMAVTNVSQIITEARSPFRIVHVNQAWCEMCGFSAESAIGQTCAILQGPGTCAATLQALKRAADLRLPLTVKLVNYTAVRNRAFNHTCARPCRRRPLPVAGCAAHAHRAALLPAH